MISKQEIDLSIGYLMEFFTHYVVVKMYCLFEKDLKKKEENRGQGWPNKKQ